jgi:hypothetical protein
VVKGGRLRVRTPVNVLSPHISDKAMQR